MVIIDFNYIHYKIMELIPDKIVFIVLTTGSGSLNNQK